ncbi:MAG: hypothetical protein ACK4WF_06950 [Candidatus Brocadiales bacterium]
MTDKDPIVNIFSLLAKPIVAGKAKMKRRSSTDKEYFAQDWIEEQLQKHFQIHRQGRNSHPDYILTSGDVSQGLEVKSLECRQKDTKNLETTPCRTDVDFNSCIPCGLVQFKGKRLKCYYAFVLYESDTKSALHVDGIAITIVDGNFLNRDFDLAVGHRNISEGGFGSYGDAFIRTRKMYRFPNPLTHPQFRYKNVLVTEFPLDTPTTFGLKAMPVVQKIDKTGKTWPFNVYTLA